MSTAKTAKPANTKARTTGAAGTRLRAAASKTGLTYSANVVGPRRLSAETKRAMVRAMRKAAA